MSLIRAYAASATNAPLQAFEYDPGPLAAEDVEIAVEHCGICHSDLSMIENEWGGRGNYPLVPGHEAVGKVVAAGERVKSVKVGDRVGLGWISGSCMTCTQCMGGDQHLCFTKQETIVRRHGGFADRVRCRGEWAIKLPDNMDHASAGPLFCGGVTVFTPILENILPTHRVGVIGIGGLGHMAIKFLNKWGCEVTAFTSSEAKRAEAMSLGAHHVVSSTDAAALKKITATLDCILVTVNVGMDWAAYLRTLAPRGRLHFVGAVMAPFNIAAFNLIGGQKSVSGSPVGSPVTMAKMLDFCARHQIAPVVEYFPMSKVNEALDHLRSGKARYRIILQNDFK